MSNAASNEAGSNHINQSIWAYSGSPCNRWVEQGITRGWLTNDWYGIYDAWNSSSGYNQQWKFFLSADGSNHTYHLGYKGSGTYAIQYDSTPLDTITGLGGGTCVGQAGLEESGNHPPDSTYHADTFDATNLGWTDLNGVYHPQWGTGQYWIDYPCGAFGNVTPNCLNGQQYSNTHWADNKP